MSDPRCAKCGHPRSNHPYRHPFVGPSLEDDVKALTAKLAKAEAGLLAIAKRDEQMIWGEDYEVEEAFKDMRDIACATLAAVTETHKIKGESHE